MIGRLIESQDIDPQGDQPSERSPAALSAAQISDALINLVADQAESAQQIAHSLLGLVGIAVGPNGSDHRLVNGQRLQVLVVVAEFHQMTAMNFARVRLLI